MAAGKPCGECPNCVRGYPPSSCLATLVMGFAFDGAWAEYVVVPWHALTAVPDHVPIEQAAILADAVSTPYAGLTDRAGLRQGESVGLWGIGGLGVHAVMVARMVGASPIIALDPSKAARQRALDRGADHALDPTAEGLVEHVWELTGGLGLDVAVDLFGANRVLMQADACLGRYRAAGDHRPVERAHLAWPERPVRRDARTRCWATWDTTNRTSTSSSSSWPVAGSTCRAPSRTSCRSTTSSAGWNGSPPRRATRSGSSSRHKRAAADREWLPEELARFVIEATAGMELDESALPLPARRVSRKSGCGPSRDCPGVSRWTSRFG